MKSFRVLTSGFHEISVRIKTVVPEALSKMAHELTERIRYNIETGYVTLGWPPRSEYTIRTYQMMGYPITEGLVLTGEMLSSVELRGHYPEYEIYIGFPSAIHEYGSADGRIPARPFVRPALDSIRSDNPVIDKIRDLFGGLFK